MDLEKAKYLILEDNKADELVLIEVLNHLGISNVQITCSTSISKIPVQFYDFIFCDLNLDDSSKLNTVKRIKKIFPEAVIIVLTGLGDIELATKAIHEGAQDYILKGEFDENNLKKTILFANERNLLAKRLIQSESRFRGLIENNFDAILIANIDTTISYASPSITSILQYTPEELIGKKIIDILHPADQDLREKHYKKLLTTKTKAISLKERLLKKDGSYIWIETSISDHRHVAGINGMVSNLRDIDQEERALEQLRLSEKRLTEITNTIPGLVLRYQLFPDGTDKILYMSEGPIEIWSIKRKDIYENTGLIWGTVLDEDIYHLKASIAESAEKLSIWNCKYRISDTNHQIKWLNGMGNPNKQEDGSVIWDSIIFDITEQIKTEEALKESHGRFELVSMATNDAIWDWNLITDEFYVGDGFEKLFGYPAQKNGTFLESCVNHIHPADRPGVLKGLYDKILMLENTSWKDEFRFIKSNNEVAYVLCQGRLVVDEHNTPVRMVGAMQDITEKRNLNIDIVARNKALKCLFFFSQITNDGKEPIDNILKDSVEFIPASWQYPEIASCRITINQQAYTSSNFRESEWKLKSDITVKSIPIGKIEVFYSEMKPNNEIGPFLRIEVDLLSTIATMIGDMIEKREAEEKYLEERMLLRILIDNIPDRIYVKNLQSRYLISNKANLKFLGVKSEADLINKDCTSYFDEEATKILEEDAWVINSGKPITLTNKRITSKAGNTGIFYVNKIPLRDIDNNIIGLVGISRDITKSKESEKKLIESEANLRAIFNSTDDAYILINNELAILSFNKKAGNHFQKYHGLKISTDLEFPSVINRKQQKKLISNVKKALNGQTIYYEQEFNEGENPSWFKISIIPVKASRKIVGACIGINDMSNIKKAELEITRGAANMQALLNSTEDAYLLLNREFKVVSMNKQAVNNGKLFSKEIMKPGDSIFSYIPEPKEALKLAVEKAIKGEPIQYMQSFQDNEREISWYVKVYPINSRQKLNNEVSVVIRDITERKMYEKELLFQQELLLNSQQLASLGSVDWDLKSDIFRPSGNFYHLFGIPNHTVDVKYEFFNRIKSGDKFIIKEAFKNAVKTKKPFNLDFKTISLDGIEKAIKGKGVVNTDHNGKAVRILCALQDITEHKTADQALQMGQEIERARLAKDLHDDIGQLLTATKFRLEALPNTNPEVDEQLENVKELITYTIKEVRTITKNLSTKVLEQHGLEAAIKEVCKPFYDPENLQINIEYKLGNATDNKLQLAIYRIVQEAINNIIKHASASLISIKVLERKDHIFLQICDNGLGFDLTKENPMRGNGLSNIRERTYLFNGIFEIKSAVNEGTVITCKFPI